MAAGHVAKPKRRSPEGAYAMTSILLEHWTIKLVDRTQVQVTVSGVVRANGEGNVCLRGTYSEAF